MHAPDGIDAHDLHGSRRGAEQGGQDSQQCRSSTAIGTDQSEAFATGRLEIGSVDTRRVKVPSTDEAIAATERKRIEDAIEKLRDDRGQLSATVEAAETQKTLINNLTQRRPSLRLPTVPRPRSPTGRSSMP